MLSAVPIGRSPKQTKRQQMQQLPEAAKAPTRRRLQQGDATAGEQAAEGKRGAIDGNKSAVISGDGSGRLRAAAPRSKRSAVPVSPTAGNCRTRLEESFLPPFVLEELPDFIELFGAEFLVFDQLDEKWFSGTV